MKIYGFFELLPANMIEATYQNIRKLCSGVFSENGFLVSKARFSISVVSVVRKKFIGQI